MRQRSLTAFIPTIVDQTRTVMEAGGKVIVPTEKDWEQAWEAYRGRPPGDAGIVDSVSLMLMRRFDISDVFTNDRHFRAAGFNTLF